jgi:transposase
LLGEFGIVIPQGIGFIATRVPELIEDGANELPGAFRLLVQRLLDHLKDLDHQVEELEAKIQAWHRGSDLSRKLAQVPGIGPITASALVASIGDAKNFDSGRQVAAWLGLVPKQHSSGGKASLLGMSKRGDTYLRTLLIHGARSVIYRVSQRADACSWIAAVVNRRNKNVAAVALANKNARIVRALLAHDPVCKLLMSVPGVGPVTALSFKAGVDDPGRFTSSRTVAAHFGLTPRRFQSGESDNPGHISRAGDADVRSALYVAAHSLLTRNEQWSSLKAWGIRLAKTRGHRRAVIAVARKLAVILHRMWVDGTVFRWGAQEAAT